MKISVEMYNRLKLMAAKALNDDDYYEAYSDVAMWGNVDDSMGWAADQSEYSLAKAIIEDIDAQN